MIRAGVRSFALAKGRTGKAVLVACFFDATSPPTALAKLFTDKEKRPLPKLTIGSRFDGKPVEMLQINTPTGTQFVAGQLASMTPIYPIPSTHSRTEMGADTMCNAVFRDGGTEDATGWTDPKTCYLTPCSINQAVPRALNVVHEAQLTLTEAAAGGAYQTAEDKLHKDVQPNAYARRFSTLQISVAGKKHDDVEHRGTAGLESVRLMHMLARPQSWVCHHHIPESAPAISFFISGLTIQTF
jgi:hypothetical protein